MTMLKLLLPMMALALFATGCSNQKALTASPESNLASMKVATTDESPSILGPQAAMIGSQLSYDLAIPSNVEAASATWNMGDGKPAVSSLGPLSYKYDIPGTYVISVVLNVTGGAQIPLTRQVTVIDLMDGFECVSGLGIIEPSQVTAGQSAPLSVNVPSCVNTTVTNIVWTFGDGKTATGRSVNQVYSQPGTYTVTAQVFTRFSPNTPWVTLTETVTVVPPAPQPTATPGGDDTLPQPTPQPTAQPTPQATPVPQPTAQPTPVPHQCAALGQQRETRGATSNQTVACGTNGTKTQTMQIRILEQCQDFEGVRRWNEISRTNEVVSETPCASQSCRLPDGSLIPHGSSRTLYSSQSPAGACSTVAQTRTCDNGVLGGSMSYQFLTCVDGCSSFGANGTVKMGVAIGEVSVPITCRHGEEGYFDIYNQVVDQTCAAGQVVNGPARQGTIKTPGSCPTYSWSPTESWTTCTADCGGKQTRISECRDGLGRAAPADRCGAQPAPQERLCDGNAAAVARVERVVTSQESGSTTTCPANQIGTVVSKRDVTNVKTYACIDHSVKVASETVEYGAWITETYCRDYVPHRCSQDSLSIKDAKGRHDWMVKCESQLPAVKNFLDQLEKVDGYRESKKGMELNRRPVYATFMDRKGNKEKPWIAPKNVSSKCEMPSTAYVAAVCVASCATPEQEILVQAHSNLKMKYVTFLEALTQNYKYVATLTSNSSMSSKQITKTHVDQWVTEMMDNEHEIIEFKLKSGGLLRLTPNHPIVTEFGTMKLAQDFKPGESLVKLGGVLDPIVSVTKVQYYGKVYNVFVKSNSIHHNVVLTNGYLNGTAFWQNEGADKLNRVMFRDDMLRGAFPRK